jgi:hypothetical protein
LRNKILASFFAFMLIANGNSVAKASTPVAIPLIGETTSTSIPFIATNGQSDVFTLVVQKQIECPALEPGQIGYPVGPQTDIPYCGFDVFGYTNSFDYWESFQVQAGSEIGFANIRGNPDGETSSVIVATNGYPSVVTLRGSGIFLQVSLWAPSPRGIVKLSKAQFVKPCKSVGKHAYYNNKEVICKKVKTLKKWVRVSSSSSGQGSSTEPASKYETKNAWIQCGLSGKSDSYNGAQLGDSGKTLVLNRVFLSSGQISEYDFDCVRNVLSMPLSVWSRIQHTRALDGTQIASWKGMTAQWSYHPDQGLNMTISYN